MPHIVLLGDSIFDNAVYVEQGSAVIDQLRARLPGDAKATLLARDGATLASIIEQLPRVPADATHLVVSVGGNDALGHSDLLSDSGSQPGGAMQQLAAIRGAFQAKYRQMLGQVLALHKPTAVATIYDRTPFFGDSMLPVLEMGLGLFNDVILREAIRARLPVIDLRSVCDRPEDYSKVSPIEPSGVGAAKIAMALVRLVGSDAFGSPFTTVLADVS